MKTPRSARVVATLTAAVLAASAGADTASAQQSAPPPLEAAATVPVEPAPPVSDVAETAENGLSSVEQGQSPLSEAFEGGPKDWRVQKRKDALRDTQYKVNFRTYYFDRNRFDGTENESLAIGGWAGFKTGYFFEHLSLAATGYTSQHLYGDDSKDGAGLLQPGQEGYSVIGELYADVRIIDGTNVYVGRREFDTPFIGKNDSRMTPNTFQAAALRGEAKLGSNDSKLKYGAGYFDKMKAQTSEDFVSMGTVAGASTKEGVVGLGGLYEQKRFSLGAFEYYCPDVINIGYAEAKLAVPINEDWKPRFAAQFIDQRSVGDDLLTGSDFSGRQYGVKAELPVGQALFTTAYTQVTSGTNMRNPWSGCPSYTSVQADDFNRAGESAILLRAAYSFAFLDGLSAYALWVHGSDPVDPALYEKDEYDGNVEWAPTKGKLQGLSLRLRYAEVHQHGGGFDTLIDLRAIANYAVRF